MRGLEFTIPVDIEEKRFGLDKLVKNNAFQWNPLHFATFYKQFKVLDFFKKIYGEKFDLIWAMKT